MELWLKELVMNLLTSTKLNYVKLKCTKQPLTKHKIDHVYDSNKSNQPNVQEQVLHEICNIYGNTWLDMTELRYKDKIGSN